MSVILGLLSRDNASVEIARLLELAAPTARYAPDGTTTSLGQSIGMACQLFATSPTQKASDCLSDNETGDLVAFDGRIDNHLVLAGLLGLRQRHVSQAELVLAAFQRWGEGCFAQFVGEWSLALWSSKNRFLYLARDHAGTRTLYYTATRKLILWSTFLETFFVETPSRQMCREFVGSYLRGIPAGQATPYDHIVAVPAAHFLRFSAADHLLVRYWSHIVDEQINYRTDLEYEAHLFDLLSQAVERRAASEDYVVAQLSGGMDSSSIVAVSDYLRYRSGATKDQLVDTVSLFDPIEPSWNELPYIEAFETLRGKAGAHIKASYLDRDFGIPEGGYLYPGADASTLAFERTFEESLGCGRFRAILSGIGGDELLGGLPNPLPELADYLVNCQWSGLLRKSLAWSYSEKISLWHLLGTVWQFARNRYTAQFAVREIPWLSTGLQDSAESRFAMKGPLPSTIDRALAWESVLETMPHTFPAATVRYEYRYPLLDRDLVDFLLRIPPEQVRRPGQRRSLMRRTVGPILPPKVVGRMRKASLKRGPILLLEERRNSIEALFRDSSLAQAGYIDPKRLLASVRSMRNGDNPFLRPALMRTLQLEIWLRSKPPLN